MDSSVSRRRLLQATSASLGWPGFHAAAGTQDWPGRIVRFVTQSAPGDAVDLRLRDFLQGLAPLLGGATLVPDNKPGAGGVLSTQSVINAPADGSNVLVANATMTILPAFNRKLPYDPLTQLTPVALQGVSPIGLAIPASRPEKTLAGWVKWAQSQKGQINYCSVGNGSVSHLYGFQLADQMGFEATHIPYKGGTPGLLAMVGGDVQYAMLDTFSLRPLLSRGNLRILAITGDERSKYLPNVPTFTGLGFPGFDRTGWTGYFVRSGTQQSVVDRLAQAIGQLSATPEWNRKREEQWSTWRNMSPAELAGKVRAEAAAWSAIVHKAGVYAD
jgi:tripartite-type tricarboxylate transporter receptor subunit TctC